MIALANIACAALFWELFSIRRDVISRLSIATAYPALFLTAAALSIGPWNVLRGRTNPVSFDLRRDLGIWAGIMALLHTGIGLNVHLRGRPWLYFIDQHHQLRQTHENGQQAKPLQRRETTVGWISRKKPRSPVEAELFS